ncbi:MAG: two-component sensor histidine kinase [Roseateles depolymerans]|uniref:Virulence sensor protein BvgS n=1 Tax=Roseateles depolymerans TaxID=76731 RepID=A0A2W5DVC4_9BURK|nr:MAG: two-component sensor histidine kinase [Roseateles depolymerans]
MVLLFAVLLIVTAWVAVFSALESKRQDALNSEVKQNRNLARALSEQTLRVIATVDQAMQRVNRARADEGLVPQDLVRFANETGLAPRILVQLSLIGADGRLMGSNLDPTGSKSAHVDLSDREHVRVHLQQRDRPAAQDSLFIGKPVLGKVSQRWTIQLSRALRDAQGHMSGVVVASLDPSYFEQVFATVDLGQSGSVTLVGQDLNVRARIVGGKPSGMGEQLPLTALIAPYLKQSEGNFQGPSSLDGLLRSFAFRRVADFPLFISVSTSIEESLVDWQADRRVLLGLCVLLTVAVAGAALIFVTGLRRLERSHDALRISEAQAQAANQAKSEFLAAISHELRTPLTSIRGFAELMERRLTEERFREAAGLIRKGAEHLNALLSEILDLAKVEAGSMSLLQMPVELRPLLQGSADFFALSAEAKGLHVSAELDPALPLELVCDGLRLKQILNNLLSNAIKFTSEGEVRLRATRLERELLIEVIDTGPGIPRDKHEQIFEKFRQGDAQVSYQHGGTGLGLALSRALAQLMGGTLNVESEPGQGATFSLRIPLDQA